MPNLVLYRKYRPQKFSEVVGQTHVVQTLSNAIKYDMAGHAYLFTGPRGTGKTTLARLLAKGVNCTGRKEDSGEPCCICDSCIEIAKGNAIDLVEIDAASNRGIDEMRELKEGVRFVPNKSKYRVFIIDECHQLTKEASNALLKTLEEPPEHAIFILATTDPQKMIPTIASRCQRFDLHTFSIKDIAGRLTLLAKSEGVSVEDGVFDIIAFNAQGSLRDAESILNQIIVFCGKKVRMEDVQKVLGVVDTNEAADFMDFLFKKNLTDALLKVQGVLGRGADPHQFMKTLVSYARQMLLAKIDSSLIAPEIIVLTNEQQEKLCKQIEPVSEMRLKKMVEILVEASQTMKYAPFVQIPLEVAAVEIVDSLQSDPSKLNKS